MRSLKSAKKYIKYNAICPGYGYTPVVEMLIGEQAEAQQSRRRALDIDLGASV